MSIFCLFLLLFVVHDIEEIVVQHRWMLAHRETLARRFPRFQPAVRQLLRLNTRAFAVAALEEWLVLWLAVGYVWLDGPYVTQIASALFMAYAVHLLVHVLQALAWRGYVPGLLTALLQLPLAAFALCSLWSGSTAGEILLWSLAAVAFVVANLRFAHWLGMKCK